MKPDHLVTLPHIKAYENLAFGLFIHWGLYSQLERGEWAQHHRKIPKEEYHRLFTTFTAADFNPRKIVKLAKEAGMKYICLTTRHHDGFSLYDTCGLNTYDAVHSPAGRDLIREYAAACHEEDMKMFFYHTTLDWEVEAFEKDWDKYHDYLNASVELLCKNYGTVSGFWFDGNWSKPEADWKEDRLYSMIRKYQPQCMIINNSSLWARGRKGHPELDAVTFEQGKPIATANEQTGKYLASEMCDTMNSHWGTSAADFSYKSPAEIIKTLASCRRNKANLLLNIGLLPQGGIPEYEAAVLKIAGKWIQTYGSSIYKGVPAKLTCKGEDFILELEGEYYYFLYNLPIYGNEHLLAGESGEGMKTISGKLPAVAQIQWVDNNENLAFTQSPDKEILTFYATKFPYGEQSVIRVAKIIC